MTDHKLRDLQNQFNMSGAPEDEAALLLERVRIGDFEQEKLKFLFHLNYPAARIAFCGHPELEISEFLREQTQPIELTKLSRAWCFFGTKSAIRAIIAILEFACSPHDQHHKSPEQASSLLMRRVVREFDAVHGCFDSSNAVSDVIDLFPTLDPNNLTAPSEEYRRDSEKTTEYRVAYMLSESLGSAPPTPPEYELTSAQRSQELNFQLSLHHILTEHLFLPKAIEGVEGFYHYNEDEFDDEALVSEVGYIVREICEALEHDEFVDQSTSELITTFESLGKEALIPWALGIGDPIKDRMEALRESGN